MLKDIQEKMEPMSVRIQDLQVEYQDLAHLVLVVARKTRKFLLICISPMKD